MSTIKTNNHQVGQSATANQNFTLYQPATPDGTVRLGVGNAGATTLDVITATNAGNVTIAGTLTAASIVGGYAGPSSQLFTANGTFTVPSGITAVKITVLGGGGGGAGAPGSCGFYAAYNGGYGGTAIAYVTGLTPGGTISITVGAAGTAGAAGNNAGGTGGTSSAGAYASASGGVGGGNTSGAWGAGGAGTVGTFIGKGAGGATVINGSLFGIGGASRTSNGNGNPGTGRGAPGSGGATDNAATQSGGAGSAGMVLVEW